MSDPERTAEPAPTHERPAPAGRSRLRSFLLVAAALVVVALLLPRACRSPLLPRGSAVPAFDLPRADGPGRVRLEGLRGRRAVLFFWAVWCPACKPMLPGLGALAREHPDVAFVTIHADGGVQPAAIAARTRPFPALLPAYGGERLLSGFRVGTLPSTYVLDPAGRVCDGFVGRTGADAIAEAVARCGE